MNDKILLKDFYKEKEELHNTKIDKSILVEEVKKFNYLQTQEEKELYKKFCDIANADPDHKFKFEHVDKLGVNADFVIIYGKKGIGKTYQISKIINDLSEIDPNAEVILIRNTISEFSALDKQLSVDYCPIFMKGKNTNNPVLYHKRILRGKKPRYMGFCAALNGFALEAAKGAEYPNIRLIIWDECTNIGSGSSYDVSDIDRFITFFDSIIRNKTNVKIYIFGNFHRNTDDKVSDVLLDTLRIPYGCTLKKVSATSNSGKNKSTFLYINTGSLYSGVDDNAKVSFFSKEIQEDLYSNMPQSRSSMVGGLNIFYSHAPEWGLVFNEAEETFILLLSQFNSKRDEFTTEINWMIHMEKFPTRNVFIHDLLTSDVALYNEFRNHDIHLINPQEERLYIKDLFEICLAKSLYYSSDVTRELFRKQMKRWQESLGLSETSTFFKKNSKWSLFN